MKRRTFNASILSLSALPTWATVTDSVYNLQMTLTNQSGQSISIDAMRGRPVIATMFYTSCQMVCPMIVEAIRATEEKLTPSQRDKLAVLMVSFDPDRDTVEALKATAEKRGLTAPHWTLARSDSKSVRQLAAVLGIQYRPTKDGEFNHSSVILLLDGEGRIKARTNQITGADPQLVRHIKSLV